MLAFSVIHNLDRRMVISNFIRLIIFLMVTMVFGGDRKYQYMGLLQNNVDPPLKVNSLLPSSAQAWPIMHMSRDLLHMSA